MSNAAMTYIKKGLEGWEDLVWMACQRMRFPERRINECVV